LRRAMADLLPPCVRDRRDKLGFATPEQVWFRGPLRQQVREGVADTLALYPRLFDRPAVEAHTEAMLDGRRPVDFSLWRLVSLGVWGQVFGVALR
ncbi:MAG TPA: asparagine synthase-related protein, partial [Stellaceae bacterium]